MSRALAALLAGWVCCLAQAPSPKQMVRGHPEASRVGELVQEGALPRAELEKLQAEQAERQDEAVLERTLYGALGVEDLTEEQGRQMVAAAERRWQRRRARLEEAKNLVESGALPRLSLTPLLEELDQARRVLDQALSRARLLEELAAMARTEAAALRAPEPSAPEPAPPVERFAGGGAFPAGLLRVIAVAFQAEFGRPLPVSANGATAVHRALGFDHRGRVDVALDPDEPQGVWLRHYLQKLRVPYYAFRSALRGRSTGPHIHIGPPSEPLRAGGG